ncbi:polysaccharide deacetylase family protein [Thermococcus paralvinellae]|uniref:Glycoside hydrolase/deacetylase n=1 Tax=Thermococcus paralvinellae TaxID=582419 RepID=W0I4X0_9EURY|nr:glycoside hydrolase [Thermococcus paralvinellae]AHF79423.1 Putative glycoside hydrolase/deacetylase [Thermococcus paralvinellae]
MFQKFGYHFHAYQPGDIIYIHDGSGWDPIKYSERLSPVSLRIRDIEVKGRNWTRAIIKAYEYVDDTLMLLKKGSVSVDFEPFTLYMVLRYKPKIYGEIVETFQNYVEAVPTVPFHPIMPHLSIFEQKILAKVSFDFYEPFIKDKSVVGFWLPENVITRKTAGIITEATDKGIVFLLDERQFVGLNLPQAKFSCNTYKCDGRTAFLFGRDHQLSDAFAFNTLDAEGLIRAVAEGRVDVFKEKEGIPYLVFLSSDLEALLSNPQQLDKFLKWVKGLKEKGVEAVNAVEFVRKKLSAEYKCLEGECSEQFRINVKDYSSWSDYYDLSIDGRTSDMRWTGVRREDNKVINRWHKGKKVSQLWKFALTKLFRELNRAVRFGVMDLIKKYSNADDDSIEEFLVRYARIFFREHYEYFDLDTSVDYVTEPIKDVDPALSLKLGRIYYIMLLANHSCPRFWENIDTRVTFGNVVAISKALIELIEIYIEENSERANFLLLEYMKLLAFPQLYYDYDLFRMQGLEGWETSEEAWFASLESEVPNSKYNVVTRAALYIGKEDLPQDIRSAIESLYDLKQAVADTGHISGERHGEWENKEWCEHRSV